METVSLNDKFKRILYRSLENFLKMHGIDYSNWDSDVKESFINCIRQSPEIKSCQIEDYINNKFPEIKELYTSHIKYEKNLSNYYSSGMFISKINLKYIGKCLISEISELFLQNFDNTLNALIKGNSSLKESIEKRAAEIIYDNIYYDKKDLNDDNDSFINYRKVYELSNKLKNGKLLGYLEKSINVAFKTNLNLVGCINVSLGLLELITSVHELYKCFLETDDNLDNQFKNELNNIRNNFEIHRDIGLLPQNYDDALQKIADAIDNINKDRNDLIDLIYRIDKEISKKKIEKEKSLRKIIKNALFVGVSVTGAIFASGPGALAFVVSSAAYGVKTITQSKKFHKAKKKLKNYEETFREAIQFENKIELELEHLLKIYKNINEQYLPADYKNHSIFWISEYFFFKFCISSLIFCSNARAFVNILLNSSILLCSFLISIELPIRLTPLKIEEIVNSAFFPFSSDIAPADAFPTVTTKFTIA